MIKIYEKHPCISYENIYLILGYGVNEARKKYEALVPHSSAKLPETNTNT